MLLTNIVQESIRSFDIPKPIRTFIQKYYIKIKDSPKVLHQSKQNLPSFLL